MVVAGAGTGKTSVIAHRFIYLTEYFNIDPKRILCVTFTNKAVKNLRDRIERCIDISILHKFEEKENIQVMTFHALCKKIISSTNDSNIKKISPTYRYRNIVKEILLDYENINANYIVATILEKLRWLCKSENRDFTEEDLMNIGVRYTVYSDDKKFLEKFPLSDIREIYDKFNKKLNERNLMTIDDIILDAQKYLSQKAIADKWSAEYDYILCDEFQDVDEVQFDILTKLCQRNNNIFCVGDPDQSIYGFRGGFT